MADPIVLTDDNFESEVLESDRPVLVDFWATWCGPCRMVSPIVEELAGEYLGRAKVGKLDVDSAQKTAQEYGIRSIPTLLIFREGKGRRSGHRRRSQGADYREAGRRPGLIFRGTFRSRRPPMPPDPFWSNLFRRRDRGGDELYEAMSKVPVFQDLSRREFERVREVLHPRTYAAEEAIVREGDPGVGMYVILSGEVAVLQEEGEGAAVEVATFGEGDFFGDQVLLDESPRTASAVARQPTRVMGFLPSRAAAADREPAPHRTEGRDAALAHGRSPAAPDQPLAQGGPAAGAPAGG